MLDFEYEKRETRALSQEVDDVKDEDMKDDNDDFNMDIQDVEESEDEGEIVLIEEEYKWYLSNSESYKGISRKDFEFIKLIGSGAHAKVYLVRKIDTQKLYAIKVLHKNQNKGTKVERKILVS